MATAMVDLAASGEAMTGIDGADFEKNKIAQYPAGMA